MLRVKKLRDIFIKENIEGLLVSNFYNILYLTGFKTLTDDEREAWVLVTKNNVYLFTDGRYLIKNFQFPISNLQTRLIEPGKSALFHLQEIIKGEKIKRLGIEGEDLKLTEYQKLKKTFPEINIVSTEKLIVKLREIKEGGEIEKIKKACEIVDRCLEELVKTIKVGMTEKEVAFKVEFWLKENGCNTAFDPIVAVDKNSAIPHYATKDSRGIIKNNSIILIDFGAEYEDYSSDITRMIFIGKPDSEKTNIYKKLLSVQEKTINACVVRSDNRRSGNNVDSYCRQLIADNQLPDYPHSTGHGVGLQVHEYPKISQTSSDIIAQNQVFTIEPGVYLEGKWGMRIEDTVTIGIDSGPRALTQFSKEPIVFNTNV